MGLNFEFASYSTPTNDIWRYFSKSFLLVSFITSSSNLKKNSPATDMARSLCKSCITNNDESLGAYLKNDLDNNSSKYSSPKLSIDLFEDDRFKKPSAIQSIIKLSLSNT
ncbi:hypothetical protein Hanom_Chr04g00291611 [Helianthus anomalus]